MRKYLIGFLILFCNHLIFSQNNIIINNININGNNITKEDIILRELEFTTGDTLYIDDLNKKIQESKQNLINLGLFNFVDINTATIKQENKITINVTERWFFWPFPILEVSERNFNTWWREFRNSDYSDFSRLNYGLFVNWENFRGRNEIIKLKIRKGFKEHYLFSYEIPYFNKNKTLGITTHLQLFRRKKSFYKTEQNSLIYYTNNNDFTTKDYEFQIELLYRKGMHLTHKIKAHYFMSNVDDTIITRNPDYLHNGSNSGSYTKVTYQFISENRDYIEYPLYGNYFHIESSKYIKGTSPVSHFEIIGKIEQHTKLKNLFFLGSSLKAKLSSSGYQPYFSQEGFGFDDYVRGYEYYVIDGQDFWLSKTVIKYPIIKKTTFNIPYIKMKQFNKSHYSLYLGVFSDMGYMIDEQSFEHNSLSNSFLFGKGISLDYVTYYDKLIRIEFSINYLGEKGVFLHFSNPFGEKK